MLLDMTSDKRQNQANKARAWSGKEEYTGSFCTVTERKMICVKPCRKEGTVTLTQVLSEQRQNSLFVPQLTSKLSSDM